MDIVASKANTIYAQQGLHLATSIPVPGTGKNATSTGAAATILKQSSSSKNTTINIPVTNNHKQPVTGRQVAHALKMAAG